VYGITRKFLTILLKTRPPHLNNVATLPCEKQLIWCCLLDSQQYTQLINRLWQNQLLSEPPTYYRGRLLKIRLAAYRILMWNFLVILYTKNY